MFDEYDLFELIEFSGDNNHKLCCFTFVLGSLSVCQYISALGAVFIGCFNRGVAFLLCGDLSCFADIIGKLKQ